MRELGRWSLFFSSKVGGKVISWEGMLDLSTYNMEKHLEHTNRRVIKEYIEKQIGPVKVR